jgi:hypothetical protein
VTSSGAEVGEGRRRASASAALDEPTRRPAGEHGKRGDDRDLERVRQAVEA